MIDFDHANACVLSPPDLTRAGGCRVGLRIVLFDPVRRSLAWRPAHLRRHLYVTSYAEGFSHFVTSMTAPVASGVALAVKNRPISCAWRGQSVGRGHVAPMRERNQPSSATPLQFSRAWASVRMRLASRKCWTASVGLFFVLKSRPRIISDRPKKWPFGSNCGF